MRIGVKLDTIVPIIRRGPLEDRVAITGRCGSS